ncbi:MAG TPA: hypothetical protein VFY65_17095 [Longimicrobium sp.]|nr:hypothetical protein [Longimicrobium sp.]
MKTLRITAALLLALAAVACSGSPTGPTVEASERALHMDGGGFFGGGTRQP